MSVDNIIYRGVECSLLGYGIQSQHGKLTYHIPYLCHIIQDMGVWPGKRSRSLPISMVTGVGPGDTLLQMSGMMLRSKSLPISRITGVWPNEQTIHIIYRITGVWPDSQVILLTYFWDYRCPA